MPKKNGFKLDVVSVRLVTATEDEQIGIFERYCKFLNSLDCNYKITINNKNKNMAELREKVLISNREDGFNHFRKIYNQGFGSRVKSEYNACHDGSNSAENC